MAQQSRNKSATNRTDRSAHVSLRIGGSSFEGSPRAFEVVQNGAPRKYYEVGITDLHNLNTVRMLGFYPPAQRPIMKEMLNEPEASEVSCTSENYKKVGNQILTLQHGSRRRAALI